MLKERRLSLVDIVLRDLPQPCLSSGYRSQHVLLRAAATAPRPGPKQLFLPPYRSAVEFERCRRGPSNSAACVTLDCTCVAPANVGGAEACVPAGCGFGV